jgi:hypothetical protein
MSAATSLAVESKIPVYESEIFNSESGMRNLTQVVGNVRQIEILQSLQTAFVETPFHCSESDVQSSESLMRNLSRCEIAAGYLVCRSRRLVRSGSTGRIKAAAAIPEAVASSRAL